MPRKSRKDEVREVETRNADKRLMPQTSFESALYIPPEIVPTGYVYRWVGKTADNAPIPGLWAKRMRQGWRPVPRSRHIDLWPFIATPGINEDSTIIEMGGLVLCEMLKRDVEKRKEYLEQEANEQMNSIAWSTDGMQGAPTVNESSKVTKGQAMFKD